MQPFTKQDGTKGDWAIMAYEETKGISGGPPDHNPEDAPFGDEYLPDVGKNAIYHSFEFTNPDLVSAGNIINLPETDENGSLIYLREVATDENGEPIQDEDGNWILGDRILDWEGLPRLAYENARRPRFILQGKSAMGLSKTIMVIVYKEGQEGQGRQSDIMLRRVVVPAEQTGNPYRFSNIVCDATAVAENGETVCVDGVQNMSSVTPTETWNNPDSDPNARGDGTKVVEWTQTVENLANKSSTNPYENARAHRGALRGDFVVMGYSAQLGHGQKRK